MITLIDDNSTLPEAPYRGIESFRFIDRPIFFARGKETRKLLRYVTIYRGTLLYGNSGTGKSSLINAGLIPAVIEENFTPDRIRVQPQPGGEIIIERISKTDVGQDRFLPSNLTTDDAERVILPVGAFKERVIQFAQHQSPLLIFDQFEEFVTLFEEAPRGQDLSIALAIQGTILQVIVELLRDHRIPVKLLFVFREDYLAKLTKLFVLYPDLQDQYLRLTQPRIESLPQIIRGSFEDPALRKHFGRELSEGLTRPLIEKIIERAEGGSVNLTEVQIVCSELWYSQHPDLLFKRRGIQGLLEDYTDNAIDKLAEENLKDPAVALLSRLVTSSGTRNIVSKEELVSRVHEEEHIEQNIVERALEKLEVKTKLVIREQRHGNAIYEIVSEFLIPWIIQQRTERATRIKHREWEEIAQHKGYARDQSTKDVPELTRQHLAIMTAGVHSWNEWRQQNPEIRPNLSRVRLNGLDLTGANLEGAVLTDSELRAVKLAAANLVMADLSGVRLDEADLREVNLEGANLFQAALDGANLTNASLRDANLAGASLVGALLKGADLRRADLSKASLIGADLAGADLSYASVVETNLEGANLESCSVYGIAAWDLNLNSTRQHNLTITRPDEPTVTVDNLEVAQFIYMLLHNEKIRDVLKATTSKAVLILGRFTPERKAVLDAIRKELRLRNYLPILFDFEAPGSRHATETISTLAHMARFIIADLTEASSLPKELEAIVPTLAVPVQPVIEDATRPYNMFPDYWKYSWVLKVYRYESLKGLIAALGDKVIAPAEGKVQELEATRKAISEELLKQSTVSEELLKQNTV